MFPFKPEGDLILGPTFVLTAASAPWLWGLSLAFLNLEVEIMVPASEGCWEKSMRFDVAAASGSEELGTLWVHREVRLSPFPSSMGKWEVGGLGLRQCNLPLPPGAFLASLPGPA